jgi:hypothetical protein
MAQLFAEQMLKAAMAMQSDVILLRHGLFPEALDAAAVDVVLYLNGTPALLTDMLLYLHPEDGFWLVPTGVGPHLAIEKDGLRVAEWPPYFGTAERSFATKLMVQTDLNDQEIADIMGWSPQEVARIRKVYVDQRATIVAIGQRIARGANTDSKSA